MAKAPHKSAKTSTTAGGSDPECLFDPDTLPTFHYAGSQQLPHEPQPAQRSATPSESTAAQEIEDSNLFGPQASISSLKPGQDQAAAAQLIAPHTVVRRLAIISIKKQRISGLQPITTAAETISVSANKVLTVFKESAYQHVETTAEGVQVEYQLSAVGRTELGKRTMLDRKTLRLAIRVLIERGLIVEYAKSVACSCEPAIYRLCDPDVAAAKLRSEGGPLGWKQIGRGRVLVFD